MQQIQLHLHTKQHLLQDKGASIRDYVSEQTRNTSPRIIRARHYLLVDYFNSVTKNKQPENEGPLCYKKRHSSESEEKKNNRGSRSPFKRSQVERNPQKQGLVDRKMARSSRYTLNKKQERLFPKLLEQTWINQVSQKIIDGGSFVPLKPKQPKRVNVSSETNGFDCFKRKQYYSIELGKQKENDLSSSQMMDLRDHYGDLSDRKKSSQQSRYQSLRRLSQQKGETDIFQKKDITSKLIRSMMKRAAIDCSPYGQTARGIFRQRTTKEVELVEVNMREVNLCQKERGKRKFRAEKQGSFFEKYCPWENIEEYVFEELKQSAS